MLELDFPPIDFLLGLALLSVQEEYWFLILPFLRKGEWGDGWFEGSESCYISVDKSFNNFSILLEQLELSSSRSSGIASVLSNPFSVELIYDCKLSGDRRPESVEF